MSDRADVRSLEVLGEMRGAVLRFREEAMQSLSIAAAEIQRTMQWISDDRLVHWRHEVRKREDAVTKAKLDVLNAESMKQFGKVSSVEERKVLARKRGELEEAQTKVKACQHWVTQLEKELTLYAGGVQSLGSVLDVELPRAAERLQRMGDILDEYASAGGSEMKRISDASQAAAVQGYTGSSNTSAKSAAGDEVSMITKYRRRVIRGEDRLAIREGEATEVQALSGEVNEAHAERAGMFADLEDVPAQMSWIAVEAGVEAARSIVLARTKSSGSQDSGWSILAAAEIDDPPATKRALLSDVLGASHSLYAALGLPVGWGVIVDRVGVTADVRCVFDQSDRVVWGTLERTIGANTPEETA
ncbi:MAG: hypothetical protein AAGB34_01725 [Planctomycetota bacterium]